MIKSILCGFLVILLAEQSSAIHYRDNPYSASNYVNPKVTTPFVPIEWSTINNSVKGTITAEATKLIQQLEAARKVEPYLYKSYKTYDLDPYNQGKVYKYSSDDSSANYNYDYKLYGKIGYQYFSPRKDVAQYGEDYNSYSQKYENHYDGSYTQEKPYEKNYHAEPYQKLHPEPYSKTYKEHHSEPYKSESYHSEPYKSESYHSEPYHSESYSKEYRSEPYSSEYSKSYPEPYSKSSYPDHYSKPYSSEYSKSYPEHKEKRYSERYRTLKAKVLLSEKMKSANIPFAKKLSARAIKLRNEFY